MVNLTARQVYNIVCRLGLRFVCEMTPLPAISRRRHSALGLSRLCVYVWNHILEVREHDILKAAIHRVVLPIDLLAGDVVFLVTDDTGGGRGAVVTIVIVVTGWRGAELGRWHGIRRVPANDINIH